MGTDNVTCADVAQEFRFLSFFFLSPVSSLYRKFPGLPVLSPPSLPFFQAPCEWMWLRKGDEVSNWVLHALLMFLGEPRQKSIFVTSSYSLFKPGLTPTLIHIHLQKHTPVSFPCFELSSSLCICLTCKVHYLGLFVVLFLVSYLSL